MPSLSQLPGDSHSLSVSILQDSLREFVRGSWHLVEPGVSILWGWFLDALCEVLEAVSRGEIDRLIINVPPGLGKSLFVSVFWPCWEWASDGSLRYLTISYSDKNTLRDNRRARSIISSQWFRDRFATRLDPTMAGKEQFDTTDKGYRIASSVGGEGTGAHPDRIIVDDSNKARDAIGGTNNALRVTREWYQFTIPTRISREPAIVIPCQRLATTDLSDFLLSMGGWEHFVLPMRFHVLGSVESKLKCKCHKVPDYRDKRKKEGQLLFPELYPEKKTKRLELELGPYASAAQLDQNPQIHGGNFISRDWIQYIDADDDKTKGLTIGRGWDTAATKDGGDFTCGTKMGVKYIRDEIVIVILHSLPCQIEDADVVIIQTAVSDGIECIIREEQEPGASGKKVCKSHEKALPEFDYKAINVGIGKIARARPLRAKFEAMRVWIVRGTWNQRYVDVMCGISNPIRAGVPDDEMDSSSVVYNEIVLEAPEYTKVTW